MAEPRLFAVSDLHLPGSHDKTMDVFGEHWTDHFIKISADWVRRVGTDDIVLIPGDISWAMRLEEAKDDIMRMAALPGRKVLIKGNHDFWWSSITKVRQMLPPGMYAIQNDAVFIDGLLFAGSRGWLMPAMAEGDDDAKIYARELIRLEMSLRSARRIDAGARLTVLTHFPPTGETGSSTPVTELMEKYSVDDVVYGHLHGQAFIHAFSGVLGSVRYHPVSCDGIGFQLYQL